MELTNEIASAVCFFSLLSSLGVLGVGARAQTASLPQPAKSEAQEPATPKVTLQQRGDIFMARKDYGDAVEFYSRALRQEASSHADSEVLWNKLGIAYQQQDYYIAARKAYEKALHLNQNAAEPWNNLGTTYFFAAKYKKSVKYYQHAIAIEPNSPAFHVNLGTSYTHIKKYPQAVEEYRVALTLDPTILSEHGTNGTVMQPRLVDAEYFFYLAKVFASLGRAPEAVRYLRRAFEEGFDNLKRLDQDPDFLKISKSPEYAALRKSPPVALKD
jgi:tetratricopeptide (TPR) repeat protein